MARYWSQPFYKSSDKSNFPDRNVSPPSSVTAVLTTFGSESYLSQLSPRGTRLRPTPCVYMYIREYTLAEETYNNSLYCKTINRMPIGLGECQSAVKTALVNTVV